jgi:hypothetical protein
MVSLDTRHERKKEASNREAVIVSNERTKLIEELYKLKEAFEVGGHALDNLIGNVYERIVELEERVERLEDTKLGERRRRVDAG